MSGLFSAICVLLILQLAKHIEHKEKQSSKAVLPSPSWEYRAALAKALDFISRFEFNAAKQVLNKLSKQYPDSSSILEQRYHLSKLQPDDLNHAKLCDQLIELAVEQNSYYQMKTVFSDIQKNTISKSRAAKFLTPTSYHKMMTVFVNHNDLEKAEQAFHFLELDAPDILKQEACRLLIDKYRSMHNTRKQQQYEMLFKRLDPRQQHV